MKRFLATVISVICIMAASAQSSRAQQADTTGLGRLSQLMEEYFLSLRYEDTDTKIEECDFMISSLDDSLMRQRVALGVYQHYMDSKLMGDEAVAIHVYDKWFDTGMVSFNSEIEKLNAKIFAEFNRESLIGCQAPELTLQDMDGAIADLDFTGKLSVLFFYDVTCSKCKVESILMRHMLEETEHDIDVYCIYVGTDEDEWKAYVSSQLDIKAPNARIHHLWDPSGDSNLQKKYGVLQTPRMFLVDHKGEILGRGLDTEALTRLLGYAQMARSLYMKCPVGSRMDSFKLPAVTRTWKKDKAGTVNLHKVKNAYVVFYSPTCGHCKEEIAAMERLMAADHKVKVIMVDVDAVASEELFDAFDLSVLPYIIRVDKKHKVADRYISFLD